MAKVSETKTSNLLTWIIQVTGIVQGVGFRPFVYQLAHRWGINGWVCNTGEGVFITASGSEKALNVFVHSLKAEAPPLARITDVLVKRIPLESYNSFDIRHSHGKTGNETVVPPDICTCHDCLSDISDPTNCRYRYPFTNCTNCGPRFTIIRGVPYDRPSTTMDSFTMCPTCQKEYEDPSDRRFHAQPIACPKCGPHLTLDDQRLSGDAEVVSKAVGLLREGKILAVKGLGGYHLACDAYNNEAVDMLRQRKGRAGKPFALMCADLDETRRICRVDNASEALLASPERPIVLMPSLPYTGISASVAPGQKSLGVMLPYTPLHTLLMLEGPKVLVMTSGNLSEEPIVHRDDEALEKLGRIADHILSHNRPIHVPCDDSVARVFDGKPLIIRRARGYVPVPVELDEEMPQVLACGGDLKSTFCITKGRKALLSQHLGDQDNVATQEHYHRIVDHFCDFFGVKPQIVAHDLHPDYRSTRFAKSIEDTEKIAVQHHHAHAVSCMAENRLSGPVIAVVFDGTGYGTDGCIWGGEFLIADQKDYTRAAHLKYIPIPGGEAAIQRPGRMAMAYLIDALGPGSNETGLVSGLSVDEVYAVKLQVERKLNAPLTSSMGRLFDAVSALLGICSEVTYEGQAAIELEIRSSAIYDEVYSYRIFDGPSGAPNIDVAPMIVDILDAIKGKQSVERIGSIFHSTIADMTVSMCELLREQTGLETVVLTGGVFQNVLLLELVTNKLNRKGFQLYRHSLIPPNDGGISLGQAVVAARRYIDICV